MTHLSIGGAWSGIVPYASRSAAADIFRGFFADFALRKARDFSRNTVGDPMVDSAAAAAFQIDHQDSETFGPRGSVNPRQLGRNVLADAVLVLRRVGSA